MVKRPSDTQRATANRIVLAFVSLLVPATVWAQVSSSGIAGVVRDTSGAVLPGVTVEASSPALIEKVRTVVTDSAGQYKIVDLRIGTYAVTFSLAGFSSFKREGIVLTSGFTATVNGDLEVGSVAETVTVAGQAPLVDTQNVRQQQTVSSQVLDQLPSGSKGVAMLVSVTPGLSGLPDVGGSAGTFQLQNSNSGSGGGNNGAFSSFHGKPGSKTLFDGMRINNMDGQTAGFIVNMLSVEEMTVETGGASAETTASGVTVNMIPKDGSNLFAGSLVGLYSNDHMQSDNVNAELRNRGVASPAKFLLNRDVGGTLGGPVKPDKLWFFTTHRWWAQRKEILGVHNNLTPHSPIPTFDTEAVSSLQPYRSNVLRLTWQASQRNKISGIIANQDGINPWLQENTSPEAWVFLHYRPQNLYQASWSSPRTNKLLFEAGASAAIAHYRNDPRPGVTADDIGIVEMSTGFKYRATATFTPPSVALTYNTDVGDRYSQRAAVSYITGSHAFKVGFQNEQGIRQVTARLNGDQYYQFNRGEPSAIVMLAAPLSRDTTMKADLGIYAQDQWTLKRLTLNLGLRYDYFNAYVPEQHLAAGQFVPARDFAPVYHVPLWKDIDPRLGVSYDLFGTGKTALKMAVGRYVSVNGIEIADANNPVLTSVASVSRQWTDTNHNFVPDCNLTNFSLNNECGDISDQNFGKQRITTVSASDVITGFGHRPYTWDFSTEVQHEILPGASVTAGYYRTWLGNFTVTDNLALRPEDYSPYCITAPTDSRLPGGGGYQVCGLYDQSLATVGRVSNVISQAAAFGKQTQVADFFAFNFNTRLQSGLRIAGGLDTGRIVTDNCFVVDSPQQLLNCHITVPWSGILQVKLNGSYQLPRGFAVSGVFQNVPGPPILANYAVPNDQIVPGLGRNLSACGARTVCTATATVPLIVPQTQFEARRSQLDLRLTKFVRIGPRARLQANVDLYNALNTASILSINTNYSAAQWRQPQMILPGRLIQLSGQISF